MSLDSGGRDGWGGRGVVRFALMCPERLANWLIAPSDVVRHLVRSLSDPYLLERRGTGCLTDRVRWGQCNMKKVTFHPNYVSDNIFSSYICNR